MVWNENHKTNNTVPESILCENLSGVFLGNVREV